jgi:heme/copper-type cytochrome/quinol oxidase subunit 4
MAAPLEWVSLTQRRPPNAGRLKSKRFLNSCSIIAWLVHIDYLLHLATARRYKGKRMSLYDWLGVATILTWAGCMWVFYLMLERRFQHDRNR